MNESNGPIYGLIHFMKARKMMFIGLFAAVLTFLVIGLTRIQIREDIYGIFPQGETFKKFQTLLTKNKYNKQIYFRLPYREDQVESDLEKFEKAVSSINKSGIENLIVQRDVDEQALMRWYMKRAQIGLTSSDYNEIAQNINRDSLKRRLANTKSLLSGVNGWYTKEIVKNDPFSLTTSHLKDFQLQGGQSNFTFQDGYLLDTSESFVFVVGDISVNTGDTKALLTFDKNIKAFKKKWNSKNRALQVTSFGTYEIAVENALQVKQDTWLTSIISLVLILLLLVFYFRSVFMPIYLILPALFSILSGLGLVGWLRPEINAISLATAAVLLGIVLDYSFHFFTHFKENKSAAKTAQSIAAPMILGSFTTLVALGSLLFTDSAILQDFGTLALSTLSGAVIFTLFFLPVFIHWFPPLMRDNERSYQLPKKLVRILTYLLVLGSISWLFVKIDVRFDSDINHLAYHPIELKKQEELFTGINPDKQRKIVCLVSGKGTEAYQKNDRLYRTLIQSKAKKDGSLLAVQSLSVYCPSEYERSQAEINWKLFWKDKKDFMHQQAPLLLEQEGFNPLAFNGFFKGLEALNLKTDVAGCELAESMGMNRLQFQSGDTTFLMTVLEVNPVYLDALKQEILSKNDVLIFDNSALAKGMLSQVQGDFNYLLVFSAVLVFITLLLVYGRIELTLLAFAPMFFAWIWILGISDYAGLYFNFVNILVATFIFGLGDDFSIFTVDGLLQEHKFGIKALKASQAGIILSGLTTLIGTGALIFAKHPAIHSIGAISVLGIGIVMLLTLVVQPAIFKLLVLKRKAKQLNPVTFFVGMYSIALFIYFFLGSMLINLFLLVVLIPLPISKLKKRAALNYLISKLAKSTLYAGFHVRKRIHQSENAVPNGQSILIANHTSFLDILVVLMLNPKTVIMVKKWVYRSPIFGFFIRYAGFLFIEEGIELNISVVKCRLNEGYSVVIFPEGTRSEDGEIKRFHKGTFKLAQDLNVPVQALYIIGTHEVNAKNDWMINPGEIHVVYGELVHSNVDESYQAFTKRVQAVMREGFKTWKSKLAKSSFFAYKIRSNYFFKGPVLEWYIRIKWAIEAKNFEEYDTIIGDRKRILDIGTGYGYLPLYLHYRDRTRIIRAYDYDAEKIGVAQNSIRLNDNLWFKTADVRELEWEEQDVICITDVLHYLQPAEQIELLENMVRHLAPGGVLLIRDGINELVERQKRTRLTELLSTKLFRFNKTTNELHFISKAQLEDLARRNNLDFTLVDHSKRTANVLLLLQKSKNGN